MALVSPDAARVVGEHLERVLAQRLNERQAASMSPSLSSHSNNTLSSWDWYAPIDDSAEWEVRMGQLRRAPWMSDALLLQQQGSNTREDQSSTRTIPFQANVSASQFCRLASHLQSGFGGWIAESNWYREEDVFYDVKPLVPQSSIDNAGLTPSSPYFAPTARERVRKRTSQGVEWRIAKDALYIHPSSSVSSTFQLNYPLLAYLDVPVSRISPWTMHSTMSPRHVTVQGSGGSDERVLTNCQAQLEEVDDVFDAIQKQSLMTCTCASFANNNNTTTNHEKEATTTPSQQDNVSVSSAERALVMACVRQQCADATWFDAPSTQDAVAWTHWFGGAIPDIRLELSMERATRVHLGRTDAALSTATSSPPLAKSTGRAKTTAAASKRAPSKRTQAAMATLQPFLEGRGGDQMEASNNSQQQPQPIHLNYGNAAYVAASIKSGNRSNTVTHKHRVEALARIKIRKSWILGMVPPCNHDETTCIASHFEMCKRPCWRFDLTMSWSAKNRVAAEEMFCAHLLQQQEQQQQDSLPLSTHVPPSHAQTFEWLTRMAACAAQLEVEVECIDPLYHGVWLQYTHGSLNATSTTTPLPIGEMLLNQLLQHVVNLCGSADSTSSMSNAPIDIDTVSPALFSPILLQTTPLS